MFPLKCESEKFFLNSYSSLEYLTSFVLEILPTDPQIQKWCRYFISCEASAVKLHRIGGRNSRNAPLSPGHYSHDRPAPRQRINTFPAVAAISRHPARGRFLRALMCALCISRGQRAHRIIGEGRWFFDERRAFTYTHETLISRTRRNLDFHVGKAHSLLYARLARTLHPIVV